jgi:ribosomal protein S27E
VKNILNLRSQNTRDMKCASCGADMRKAGKMLSGNSVYIDWQCTKCMNRKTVCEGPAISST